MLNRPSGAEIAVALNISTARVSQLKRAGMPADSVEAALGWYRRNVDPVRAMGQRLSRAGGAAAAPEPLPAPRPPSHDAAVADGLVHSAEALAASLSESIGRPEFETLALPLRLIMQEIPPSHRRLLALDSRLWVALCRPVLAAVRPGVNWNQPPEPATTLTEAEAAEVGAFWYEVACCEAWLSCELSPVQRALANLVAVDAAGAQELMP